MSSMVLIMSYCELWSLPCPLCWAHFWSVTQNDGKVAVLGLEACFDHPITDWFHLWQSVGLLFGDNKGNTMDVCIVIT